MIENFNFVQKPEKEVLKEKSKEAKDKLYELQLKIKENKLPILVLFEGWGTAGKAEIIGEVIQNIDPRFFKVSAITAPTKEEKRKPFICRYFEKIPEQGKFQFFDTGWMDEITKDVIEGKCNKQEYKDKIESVKRFERTLTDNGYIILKFFCQISKKEQKKRIKGLCADSDTKWRVDEYDKFQNKNYEKCYEVFDKFIEDTNLPASPWYIIDAKSKKWAVLQVLNVINEAIETGINRGRISVPVMQNVFPLEKMPKLSEIELKSKTMTEEEYEVKLDELQGRLKELHNRLYKKKVPVIIAYEGWDAAGKGGNIKRITRALDPRGFEVVPIASPEPHEKARHHLWRFWNKLPKDGHITIFDRTWYGRVMVERLEGFCSENDWKRAYNEMNEFEYELTQWGAVIIKFWVQIDKDTQLERFNDRQNNPEKQWKITDEDWRNREKWDQYEEAIDEMLQKTSTTFAPWHILESTDKKYARIKALSIVIDEIEKAVK